MHTAALSVVTFAAAAAAAGQISILGDCASDTYIWLASNDKAAEAQGKVPGPGEEPFSVDIEDEGFHEIKITASDDLTFPVPMLSVFYGMEEGTLRYDLVSVFGNHGIPVSLSAYPQEGDQCKTIELTEDGISEEGGQECVEDAFLTLSLCGADAPEEAAAPEEE